jgi:hypothetical protein
MPVYELLSLDLRSSLGYRGMEHPAVRGIPLRGSIPITAGSGNGSLEEYRIGADMAEGEEEIFVFDEEDLIVFDPDAGPCLKMPLPSPRYYGRSTMRDDGAVYSLPAGRYLFLQFRPHDDAEFADGEDGRLATQILRKTENQAS